MCMLLFFLHLLMRLLLMPKIGHHFARDARRGRRDRRIIHREHIRGQPGMCLKGGQIEPFVQSLSLGRKYHVGRHHLSAKYALSLRLSNRATADTCYAASITIFVVLMIEYFVRYFVDKPLMQLQKGIASEEAFAPARGVLTKKLQLLTVSLLAMTLFLVIR